MIKALILRGAKTCRKNVFPLCSHSFFLLIVNGGDDRRGRGLTYTILHNPQGNFPLYIRAWVALKIKTKYQVHFTTPPTPTNSKNGIPYNVHALGLRMAPNLSQWSKLSPPFLSLSVIDLSAYRDRIIII